MLKENTKTGYQFKTVEESHEILSKAHAVHCADCCPDPYVIDFADRNEAVTSLVGAFPVFGSPMTKCNEVANTLKDLIYSQPYRMEDHTHMKVHTILDSTPKEYWSDNKIEKHRFEDLQQAIKQQDTADLEPNEKKFTLLKRSSPKLSNLIASILVWLGRNPEKDEIMSKFNARQSAQMKDFEMVISTEQHRIVGMSAFGKFTSCQDWIRKDKDHEYHAYTHQSWANMADSTCGILFIRKIEDEFPTTEMTKVQDMHARCLVRAFDLPNGQRMVYLHKIYGVSPYDQVLKESIDKWEKTLPENVHLIKMYAYSRKALQTNKNKFGKEYKGYTNFNVEVEDYSDITARKRCQCDNCEGSGRIECSVCDGRGEVIFYDSDDNAYECECSKCDGDGSVECFGCDGVGHFEDGTVSVEPYNDHYEYLTFNDTYITFQVPNYMMNWTEQPEHTCALPPTTPDCWNDVKVGDKVWIRADLEQRSGYVHYNGSENSVNQWMVEFAGQEATIMRIRHKGQFEINLDEGRWGWTSEMLSLTPTTQTTQPTQLSDDELLDQLLEELVELEAI